MGQLPVVKRIKKTFTDDPSFGVLLALVVVTLGVLISQIGPKFLSENNLQSMATQVAEFGLLGLAMGLAMLLGGIDLSIVTAAVLAGIVGAQFLSGNIIPLTDGNTGIVMVIGIIAALITGALTGLLNGFLISKFSIPPILTTLATMIFFSGIGMVITNGQSVPVKIPAFASLGVATLGRVPLVFIIMLVVYALVSFMLNRTTLGRSIYLYGENRVALRFSAVQSERVVLKTFLIIGLIVGLAGLIMLSRVNSARSGFGDSYQLQAILVVVLAGFDPFGGRGRIRNLLLALILLQSLQSAFTIMRFDPFMKTFIWGASLLLVMALNDLIARQRKRMQLRRVRSGKRTELDPPSTGGPAATSPADSTADLDRTPDLREKEIAKESL